MSLGKLLISHYRIFSKKKHARFESKTHRRNWLTSFPRLPRPSKAELNKEDPIADPMSDMKFDPPEPWPPYPPDDG